MSNSKFLVPWILESDGLEHLQNHAPYHGEYIWRHAEPFIATLTFIGFQRGRSAAHALYEDSEGRQFVVFLSDLEDLIRLRDPVDRMYGRWIPCKRGNNFGIKRYFEE